MYPQVDFLVINERGGVKDAEDESNVIGDRNRTNGYVVRDMIIGRSK